MFYIILFIYMYIYAFQSAGVQFPQRPGNAPSSHPSSDANKTNTLNGQIASSRHEVVPLAQQPEPQAIPESRYFFLKFLHYFLARLIPRVSQENSFCLLLYLQEID